jgi:hypothetical protein
MGEKGQVGLHTMGLSLGGVGQAIQAGVQGAEQGANEVGSAAGSLVSGLTTSHNPPGGGGSGGMIGTAGGGSGGILGGGSGGTAGDQGSGLQVNNPLYPGQGSQGGEKGNAVPISTQLERPTSEGVLPAGQTLTGNPLGGALGTTGSMSTSTGGDGLASSTPPGANQTIK